jgi:hypothetical protein
LLVSDRQLDLFSGSGIAPVRRASPATTSPGPSPAERDDAALLAAIPASHLSDGPALAAEAGRRGLHAAIPMLEAYCRRFAGFGARRILPEQVAALDALATIGGPDAAQSVARIISRSWVQGPTLVAAVAAAARLGSHLPLDIVLTLLRHADPAIRGDACRLARVGGSQVIATLTDLLGDLHRGVSVGPRCTLGHLGRGGRRRSSSPCSWRRDCG